VKQLLNVLYVTTPGSYLYKEGETVAIKIEDEVRLRLPIHTLEGIVCMGLVSCSPPLMGFCAEQGVAISFLTEHGKFLARVQGPVKGNVLLRRQQYRRADSESGSTELAKAIILAKVANCRTVAMRGEREGVSESLQGTVIQLAQSLRLVEKAENLDQLRGFEGDAARAYFTTFDQLIVSQKEHFYYRGRSRRPPMDNVNALLSFVYVLLAHDVKSALESVGLDPAVGFLHRDRPGRPGLALDLMEELRPVLADRMVLSLINRKQVSSSGFTRSETGGVTMGDPTRKDVLIAWQKRKQEEIQHPFLGEKIPFGLVPYAQSLLLARYLRGDLNAYPSFFWK
jgi:CRISPR-associated protein Cas1